MKLDRNHLGKVVAVYASASFVVLQVVDLFQARLELPNWLFVASLTLLIVGLPLVVATAIVQDNDFKSQLVERHFTWAKAIGGGVVAFVLLAGAAGFYARDRFGGNEKLSTNLVAVFPFRVSGAESSLHYLAEGMVDLLAAKLNGETGPRAADARTALAAWRRLDAADPEPEQLIRAARSIGARRLIVGEIVGNAEQLTISASVTDTRTGRRFQHIVHGLAADLPAKVDELAAVLLSLDAGEPRDRLGSLTSTSLTAVRAYLAGEDAYRHARYSDAAQHYLDALSADSTFALAALGILAANSWNATLPAGSVNSARTIAWMHGRKLSELDQLKLIGYMGDQYPHPVPHIPRCVLWDRIIQRAPERAEAWHLKADCVYHYYKHMGIARAKAEADSRKWFEKSLQLDSTFLPNIQHLMQLAVARGDVEDARRLARLFLTQEPGGDGAREIRWFLHRAEGKTSELYDLDSTRLGLANWTIQMSDDVEFADTILALAYHQMHQRSRTGRPTAPYLIAYNGLRGTHARARAHADSADMNGGSNGAAWAVVSAMYVEWDSTDALRRIAQLESVIAKPVPSEEVRSAQWHQAQCVLGQWRAWSGDTRTLDRTVAILANQHNPPDFLIGTRHASRKLCAQMIEAIRATVEKHPDAKERALQLDSINALFPEYYSQWQYFRLVIARLLEMNGEFERARVAVSRNPVDMGIVFGLGAELLTTARLSAKLGDRETAIQNYRKYLALRDPDAGGMKNTQRAQYELAQLTGDHTIQR